MLDRTRVRLGNFAAEEGRWPDPQVPSVDRALNLLELLASSTIGLKLSMISRRLNIPKSSAHYLLTTLAKRNLVRRDADRRVYSLGIQSQFFGRVSDAEPELKAICSPFIQSLSKELALTAQVGIREGNEVRIVDRSEVPGSKLDSWVGRHFDLHCTAIGKALISYLSEVEVENLFRAHGLPKHNEQTVCSLEILKGQLAEARRRGFAVDDEEHEIGVRCLASPIFNHLGGVVAAICIFGPVSRLSRSEIPALGLEIAKTAREVSRIFSGLVPHLEPTLLKV